MPRFIFLCQVFLVINYLFVNQAFSQQNKPINSTDKILVRSVAARMYYKNTWTLPDITVEQIGANLAKILPTYVSGLIVLDDQTQLSEAQVKAFNTVREVVLKAKPECKFDMVINPRQYKRAEDLVAKMTEINQKIKLDIWFFDFFRGPNKPDYKLIKAAADYAHTQGQLIGVNEWDNSWFKIVDFVVFHDGYGVETKMKEDMQKIVTDNKIPVALQINNDSERTNDDNVHNFLKKWEKHNREAYIKRLSRNQATWKYRLIYPVYYPVYLNQESYNAPKDGNILTIYADLMKIYN